MKRLILLIAMLAGCGQSDHRTDVQRAADNADACRRAGGTPELREVPWGVYTHCKVR
jgi:hypothetical protein